ncbi:peptidoglycan editing factor PgeF [Rarobacter incanus]|uniref:Purine nucleoside phosphorylase n=1 Tax=Rarobacter incanus TaxID=153494 RepID=A0A542SLJ3_9MICO|nr:peptidoglycan editing factor PgeF [Rarobacter incanus]TQK75501.1 hypothetical protein FB389_0128 [Rarobacter incanus]
MRARLLRRVEIGDGFVGGFTATCGGVSREPWASLNLGSHVGDDPKDVGANRDRLSRELGSPVAYMNQVHSNTVAAVTDRFPTGEVGTADALITHRGGCAVAVLVADCVPVLLAAPATGHAAAVHAGRAGMLSGVIAAAVGQLRSGGSDLILAAVGPHICGRCYEVPPDLRSAVCEAEPAAFATTRWNSAGLDIGAAVQAQLRRLDVRIVAVDPACTYEHDDLYSYRRSCHEGSGVTGRFAGVIVSK